MPSQGISLDGANEAKRHSGAMLMSFASSQPTKGPAGRGGINQRFPKSPQIRGVYLRFMLKSDSVDYSVKEDFS